MKTRRSMYKTPPSSNSKTNRKKAKKDQIEPEESFVIDTTPDENTEVLDDNQEVESGSENEEVVENDPSSDSDSENDDETKESSKALPVENVEDLEDEDQQVESGSENEEIVKNDSSSEDDSENEDDEPKEPSKSVDVENSKSERESKSGD